MKAGPSPIGLKFGQIEGTIIDPVTGQKCENFEIASPDGGTQWRHHLESCSRWWYRCTPSWAIADIAWGQRRGGLNVDILGKPRGQVAGCCVDLRRK